MDKKGAEKGIGKLIKAVMVIIVVLVVLFALGYLGVKYFGWAEGLPSFLKLDSSGDEQFGEKDIIFRFEDGLAMVSNLAYNYVEEDGWYWFAEGDWLSVGRIMTKEGNEPTEANKEFIRNLQTKTYEEGVKLLLARTVRNNEGGLIYSTKLVVYIGSTSKEYKHDDELLKRPDDFIKKINELAGKDG